MATYIVRELVSIQKNIELNIKRASAQVEDYAEHPDYLDKVNWYFIPSANPDG